MVRHKRRPEMPCVLARPDVGPRYECPLPSVLTDRSGSEDKFVSSLMQEAAILPLDAATDSNSLHCRWRIQPAPMSVEADDATNKILSGTAPKLGEADLRMSD